MTNEQVTLIQNGATALGIVLLCFLAVLLAAYSAAQLLRGIRDIWNER